MFENGNGDRKLCLIASKGSLDMAYPPLILANAARMSGIETHLFFTFWGLDIITKSKMKKLNVATVGNPNMHPMFHFPTLIGAIPGVSAMSTWMMNREIEKLDFPPSWYPIDASANCNCGYPREGCQSRPGLSPQRSRQGVPL